MADHWRLHVPAALNAYLHMLCRKVSHLRPKVRDPGAFLLQSEGEAVCLRLSLHQLRSSTIRLTNTQLLTRQRTLWSSTISKAQCW